MRSLRLPLWIAALTFTAVSCDCGVEPLESLPPPPPPPPEAEVGAVQGRVCAPDGETWLGGALVFFDEEGFARREVVSDADGRFLLDDVPAGDRTVYVTRGSFATARDVVVVAGETTVIPDDACQLDLGPRIAVVTGSEFDDVLGVLQEVGVELQSVVVYGDDWADRLLARDDQLDEIDVLFLSCRSNEELFSSRSDMQQRLRAYVARGGSLHASDQAYDLIEIAFPDHIDFLGDDSERGAADEGQSVDVLAAAVRDQALSAQLGAQSVDLHFGLSTWSVMVSVSERVHTYLEADAPLLGGGEIEGAPMIVGFDHGDGRVIYSSFHQEPGIGQAQENVLQLILFEL